MINPADWSVREEALDPACSCIVQAPAGSGKTELLIRRFLKLLSLVSDPEEIIAITFTRKAAAEMRNRVTQALADAKGPQPPDRDGRELWEIANRARSNDKARAWNLDRHPSRLRIQTIDSLCAAITRQMPWVSGIGAPPQVVEDALPLYQAAAAATLHMVASDHKEWGHAATVLLKHLDIQVPRAIDLLVDMLKFRDQWLRHISQQGVPDSERRTRQESVWANQIRLDLRAISNAISPVFSQEMLDCAAHAAGQLQSRDTESRILSWLGATEFPGDSLSDLPRWQGLRELLLKKDGHWRKTVNVNTGFPSGPDFAADKKRKMLELLKSLSGSERLRRHLVRIGNIPEPRFDDRQWQIISALATILPLAAAQLRVLFGEAGQVDFAEISMRANQALGSFGSPGDLAMRLDYRISHLLVDEFQDTSVSQYQIIESLTAGWQEGDGRTLFLVGDPMQSIYRFREAEVGLFLRVREGGMSNIKLKPLTLTVNFRSDPELVGWVNRVFETCFPTVPEISRGAVAYVDSTAHLAPSSDAEVLVHCFVDADLGDEAEKVADLIRQARRFGAGDRIAVLVRSRQILREILPALDDAGIAYSGLDIQRLDWEPVVQDLLSLTRALSFPADRVAWLGILRAPWCGLTLHDLHTLVADRPLDCVWDCIRDEALKARLSSDGQRRLDWVICCLTDAIENRGRLPLWRTVENLWLSLGGPACADGAADQNVRMYLDLLQQYQSRMGVEDLDGLMRLISEHWAQSRDDSDQRLQVMTLHKAKGLEFDTVIIPGLHKRPRSSDARLLLWEEQMNQGGEKSLLYAPLAEVGADRDPHYRYLSTIHQEKDHFETLRLLYVGCTRARRRLHLLARVDTDDDCRIKAPLKNSLLSKLWPALSADFEGAARKRTEIGESPHPSVRILKRLPAGWRLPELPATVDVSGPRQESAREDEIEFSWVGETARHVGVIMHGMLDRIARDGIAQWDENRLSDLRTVWHTELLRQGVSTPDSDAASSRILEALVRVLGDERAEWLFSAEHQDPRSEYGLAWNRPEGIRNLRIDRTFVDRQGTRWIIDYKSSTHTGSGQQQFLDSEQQRYKAQLEIYARAMFVMEQRPIRLGLYFPMLTQWREWKFKDPPT